MNSQLLEAGKKLVPHQALGSAYGVKELLLSLACLVLVVAVFFLVKTLLRVPRGGSDSWLQADVTRPGSNQTGQRDFKVSTTSR